MAAVHRRAIIDAAARLPAVYPYRYYVQDGGLISYGPSTYDPIRRAAAYVDRILKAEKAADLPVQVPTTYELTINIKTAKALGLTIPLSLITSADEVSSETALKSDSNALFASQSQSLLQQSRRYLRSGPELTLIPDGADQSRRRL